MDFIPSFSKNHFSGEKDDWMLLAQIIQSELTENFTNNIARNIRLNLDITFQIKKI